VYTVAGLLGTLSPAYRREAERPTIRVRDLTPNIRHVMFIYGRVS
jgi:hypothetical protein